MGCIQVHIKSEPGIKLNIYAMRGVDIYPHFELPIKITVGVVCDAGKQSYLKVDPEYIWLMPSNNFEDNVDVLSNVVWTAVQDE